ncbi:hypothetical protein SAY86_011121 [Trapa natans]|uniref:Digalactosyldiacylglycerol synthase 2, chloroplastic n=1 Tax=Trapa natans TaxID=22666 RepID=A0AAN7LFW5_TRANT|nr:hypothetical protein SAY86_011121 [Trapa natans]
MDRKQHIAIFTTASLPWMTGTAVNPLFRAAYLSKDGVRKVTLGIPWLTLKDQELVYPRNITFRTPSELEGYVRHWLEDRTGFKPTFDIRFYPAKFSIDKRSILPVGDISEIIPYEEADVAVLEEPEHLTWYHHGKRWKIKFRLVIGVIHTNYLEYVKREKNGQLQAFLLKYLNTWVVGIYCHRVIRLSGATQDYPNSIICNVHGVNPKFLDIGKNLEENHGQKPFTRDAYYIGKMIWSKGYKELLKLLRDHHKELSVLKVDLYGSGEDSDQVEEAAKEIGEFVNVHPGRDHADPLFHDYKVFLNPSTTDVVCTTTAEALAMGKFVICADHPSNEFFKQFPNCRTYSDPKGFVNETLRALSEEPSELNSTQRHELSWEAATERFLRAAQLDQPLKKLDSAASMKNFASTSFSMRSGVEEASAYIHNLASGFEISRRAFGAIPGSLKPDEELSKELGLATPTAQKQGSSTTD